MEHGNTDTNWNFACFVFENTNVEVNKNGQKNKVNLTMTVEDISSMRQNMSRFKSSCEELSNNKMQVTYDFITIQEPITTLSFDEENGYHIAPENVEKIIRILFRKEKLRPYFCMC